jgi:hypothetical protein
MPSLPPAPLPLCATLSPGSPSPVLSHPLACSPELQRGDGLHGCPCCGAEVGGASGLGHPQPAGRPEPWTLSTRREMEMLDLSFLRICTYLSSRNAAFLPRKLFGRRGSEVGSSMDGAPSEFVDLQ